MQLTETKMASSGILKTMGGVTYLDFNIWVFLPIRKDVSKGEWFCTSQDQVGLRRPSGVLL